MEEFKKLTNEEVRWENFFDQDLDKYNVLTASIVNEVQIELGMVNSFLDAIKNSDGRKKQYAEEVLGYYQKLQEDLALRRFDEILEIATDDGIRGVQWGNPEGSKGHIAIKAVIDNSPPAPVVPAPVVPAPVTPAPPVSPAPNPTVPPTP